MSVKKKWKIGQTFEKKEDVHKHARKVMEEEAAFAVSYKLEECCTTSWQRLCVDNTRHPYYVNWVGERVYVTYCPFCGKKLVVLDEEIE